MIEKITKEQQLKCENCHYRDKTLDKIVFCPYVNNCRKKVKSNVPNEYIIKKDGKRK